MRHFGSENHENNQPIGNETHQGERKIAFFYRKIPIFGLTGTKRRPISSCVIIGKSEALNMTLIGFMCVVSYQDVTKWNNNDEKLSWTSVHDFDLVLNMRQEKKKQRTCYSSLLFPKLLRNELDVVSMFLSHPCEKMNIHIYVEKKLGKNKEPVIPSSSLSSFSS